MNYKRLPLFSFMKFEFASMKFILLQPLHVLKYVGLHEPQGCAHIEDNYLLKDEIAAGAAFHR